MHYACALRWAFKMWVCLRREGSLVGQTVFKILQFVRDIQGLTSASVEGMVSTCSLIKKCILIYY